MQLKPRYQVVPDPTWLCSAVMPGGGGVRGLGFEAALARRDVTLALHGDGDDELSRGLLDGLARAAARLARAAGLRRCQPPVTCVSNYKSNI